jgi:hypothetical protein
MCFPSQTIRGERTAIRPVQVNLNLLNGNQKTAAGNGNAGLHKSVRIKFLPELLCCVRKDARVETPPYEAIKQAQRR